MLQKYQKSKYNEIEINSIAYLHNVFILQPTRDVRNNNCTTDSQNFDVV